MTLQELYEYVLESYGSRKCWLSELATALGISLKDARYITRSLGFARGRATVVTDFKNFSDNAEVRRIQALISYVK